MKEATYICSNDHLLLFTKHYSHLKIALHGSNGNVKILEVSFYLIKISSSLRYEKYRTKLQLLGWAELADQHVVGRKTSWDHTLSRSKSGIYQSGGGMVADGGGQIAIHPCRRSERMCDAHQLIRR